MNSVALSSRAKVVSMFFPDGAASDTAMNDDWILDVLTDLETYAHNKGMIALAEQLNETRCAVRDEIGSRIDASVYDGTERSAPVAADHEGEARSAL